MADRRRQAGYVDYDLLTPLNVKISGCGQKAATLDEDVKRVVKATQEHAINLTRRRAKEGQGRNAESYTVTYTVSQI
jgi:hypothetical protein